MIASKTPSEVRFVVLKRGDLVRMPLETALGQVLRVAIASVTKNDVTLRLSTLIGLVFTMPKQEKTLTLLRHGKKIPVWIWQHMKKDIAMECGKESADNYRGLNEVPVQQN